VRRTPGLRSPADRPLFRLTLQGTCVRGLTKIASRYGQTTVVVCPAHDDDLTHHGTMKWTRFVYDGCT
jgi:hypothetical protein